MELIAASRIVKAQQRVAASHAVRRREITARGLGGGVATSRRRPPADDASSENAHAGRGAASSPPTAGWPARYSSNVLQGGRGARPRCCARRARRSCPTSSAARASATTGSATATIAAEWTGFSEQPDVRATRRRSPTRCIERVRAAPTEEGGVDEIHVVYTEFVIDGRPSAPAVRADAAAGGRRGDRRGSRGRRGRSRCTSSSRRPRACSTRCCRATSRAASTPRCSSRRRPSTRRAGGR